MVDVVVHDKHGKLVKDLSPSDIALYQDGAPQKITSFRLISGPDVLHLDQTGTAAASPQAHAAVDPLHTLNIVTLVFHDLQMATAKTALDAALRFLSTAAQPNTYIGVFTLDSAGVHPVNGFTNDRAGTVTAIQHAAKRQYLTASQSVFQELNLQITQVGAPPSGPGPTQVNVAAQANQQLTRLGATLDASTAGGDDASVAVNNPLGNQTSNAQAVTAVREDAAFNWLVSQLSPLPFRKTFILFSAGVFRPFRQVRLSPGVRQPVKTQLTVR